jgi:DNA-binding NarL/FixJ family response regulator
VHRTADIAVDRRLDVVVVDDDGGFAESLRTVVENQPGLSVVGVANDGVEALDLVEEASPQAVLIDLHMPLLDGVTTIARLRQDNPKLCVIAMTEDDSNELHRAVEEAGADAVLMKKELIVLDLADRISVAQSDRAAAV